MRWLTGARLVCLCVCQLTRVHVMFSWISYEAYTVGASPSHIAAIRIHLGQAWAWRSSTRPKCPCKKYTNNKSGCLFGYLPAWCACMSMVQGSSMILDSVDCSEFVFLSTCTYVICIMMYVLLETHVTQLQFFWMIYWVCSWQCNTRVIYSSTKFFMKHRLKIYWRHMNIRALLPKANKKQFTPTKTLF